MTKQEALDLKKEEVIGGKTFWTLWGMSRQLPGRKTGTRTSIKQMLIYVKEGCPCFEHAGSLFFDKDLTAFLEWLQKRKPARQIKAQERIRRIYGK